VLLIAGLVMLCVHRGGRIDLYPDNETEETALTLVSTDASDGLLPFPVGEKLEYRVIFKGLRLGQAVMTFLGPVERDGRNLYNIRFETRVPSLHDIENIYADPATWRPVLVERDIRKLIGGETLVEVYDQEQGEVRIRRENGEELVISRGEPLHNPILLTYLFRTRSVDDYEQKLDVTLPRMDLTIVYQGVETIDMETGTQEAHHFSSEGGEFDFWLGTGAERIPLKIQQPGMMGYSLVLEEGEAHTPRQ
jgi:hypothetical protein